MQFLFSPAIATLSDANGRRPVLLISVLGHAVDNLPTAFAPSMLRLFIERLFAGICGASYTTENAFVADITKPDDRAKVFGLMGAAFGLGFVIGPAIGWLLGEFGPRVPFFVAAGFRWSTSSLAGSSGLKCWDRKTAGPSRSAAPTPSVR
jgi:DHA1 family tetracycline resistance protein-like MFS transporter